MCRDVKNRAGTRHQESDAPEGWARRALPHDGASIRFPVLATGPSPMTAFSSHHHWSN